MGTYPEAPIVGEVPISFSYQIAPLILDILAYPNTEYSLNEIEGHDRLNLHTILTPPKTNNPEDYPKLLPLHVADLIVGAANVGEYMGNQVFDPRKPWRIMIDMKHREHPYEREVKMSYKDRFSRPAWESRKWVGPVDDANPDGYWMVAKKDWEISHSSHIQSSVGRLLEGASLLEAKSLRKMGRILGPVELRLFSRAINDTRDYTVFYNEDEKKLCSMYMAIAGIELRRANNIETKAWDKANNLQWGEVDWSLLDSLH